MGDNQPGVGRPWRWHDHFAVGLDRVFDAVSTDLRSLLYSPLVEQHLHLGQAYRYSRLDALDGTEAFLNMVESAQATNLRDGVLKYVEGSPALRHLINSKGTHFDILSACLTRCLRASCFSRRRTRHA